LRLLILAAREEFLKDKCGPRAKTFDHHWRKVSHALVWTLQKHPWKTSKVIWFGSLHFSDNWWWPSTTVPRVYVLHLFKQKI